MKFPKDMPEPIRQRLEIDMLVFGDSFCEKITKGNKITYKRLDPMKMIIKADKIRGETENGQKHSC